MNSIAQQIPAKMRAAILTKYGSPDGIHIEEIPVPQVQENEVLIKIKATSVTPSDTQMVSGRFPLLFWLPVRLLLGLFRPRRLILGYEFSGTIVAKGKAVSRYKIGDQVFGGTYRKMSCHAEYICLSEGTAISLIPEKISIEDAAVLADGAQTALHFLELADVSPGKDILVYGASGSVGSYAVQIAKSMGAHVTAVCSSRNFEMVRTLGADDTIDYKAEDYGERVNHFDVVFDAVGRSSFSQAKPSLKQDGIFLTTKFSLMALLKGFVMKVISSKRLTTTLAIGSEKKLQKIVKLVENGELSPSIDREYSLDNLRDAYNYVKSGRKKGNVKIIVT